MLLHGHLRRESICSAEFCGGLERRVGDNFEIEGELFLADEIEGPHLHGLNDRLGSAERACKDDHGVRRVLADFCK